ncbi:MAG: glycoside hydrolase family 2 [Oscillospiraceae bacterium]|nr:glycoside hydrolase family 2 [Oscillospiraceae bacterium]
MLMDLYTAAGEQVGDTLWQVYPRPQMKRDSYLNLNGLWDFSCNYPTEHQKILVPFCPESKLSSVGEHFPEGGMLTYRRMFTLPDGFNKGSVILHIGAADQETTVFLNKKKVCCHKGGYEAFCCDITAVLAEENELVITCVDNLYDQSLPYGKQVLPEKRGGMWYTPVSGIWQTVWLESVPETYIEKLHIENRGYSVKISIEPALSGTVTVAELGSFQLVDGSVTITPEEPRLWSPENPYLYDFTVQAGEDRVESYFAIRSLEIKKIGAYQRLCLNGKPYFFHGLLDQGYWPDGLFTPATPQCYCDDILMMKKLGFNTLRKHIKVEAEEFYYQCDKLGMIVFQDMVNNGDYQFFRDTALPTVGLQKLNDKKMHRDAATRKAFREGMSATVRQLKNHPCICYWTIFNEGWGQFDSDAVYEEMKKLDDSRFIDSTSGWFRRKKSDVDSLHIYFGSWKKLKAGEKPLVLSEFGGYCYGVQEHLFNPDKAYGYKACKSLENLNRDLQALYEEKVIPAAEKGLCAAVYTQVSDVEDEINGLLTYDRKVCKADEKMLRAIAQKLQRAVKT